MLTHYIPEHGCTITSRLLVIYNLKINRRYSITQLPSKGVASKHSHRLATRHSSAIVTGKLTD